jgi:tRNA A37 methylthiotransferase MiaB
VYAGSDVTEIAALVSRVTGNSFDRFTVNSEELFYAYDLYPSLESVTLRTSSGCPFTCSYCGLRLLQKDFTQRDPGFIVDNIEYLYRVRGVRNFAFYDDALLFHAQNHALQFMAGFVARNIRANFHTPNGLNVRYIDQDVATALKASGFCHPRLGLEVVSGTRQSQTGAKVTNNEFEKAVGYLRQAGYAPRDIGVNILMGLPGQDIREIEESVRFVSGHGAVVHWEEYSPVPGTPDFLFSGLTLLSDPLLHNNSAFPLYRPDDHRRFQEIKDLVHRLNGRLNKEGG